MIECSCQGVNKNCFKCGGFGYIDDISESPALKLPGIKYKNEKISSPNKFKKFNKMWLNMFSQAMLNDDITFVTQLLQAGANINFQDKKGNTALHYAVQYNRVTILTQLIKAGADIYLRNNDNETVLDLAKTKSNAECIEVLEHILLAR